MEWHTEKEKRPMPFTEEQMRQVFDTNLIDFAVKHGYEIEKGDRNTVHVKYSGGLYLFKHGRGYYQFTGGNIWALPILRMQWGLSLAAALTNRQNIMSRWRRKSRKGSWCCRRKIEDGPDLYLSDENPWH